MNVIQTQPAQSLRRWCRTCGLPGPVNQLGCPNCGVAKRPDTRAVRDMVMNSGENVQHNVLNVENITQLVEAMESAPPPSPSFFHRFFMFTCAIALWCGIFTISTIVLFFITVVVLAVMKAHG